MTLTRVGFVPLPAGDRPGFDHADVWLGPGGPRMYVAHTGADRVDVVDCTAREFLRSLPDLPGVAGVLVDQAHDLLFTSDRATARVSVFRCSDEQLLGRSAVGQSPNGLAYDRLRRRLFAFNVGEPFSASVVDVDTVETVADIPLPGRSRWALYDDELDHIYVNINDPPLIAVIDPERLAITRTFPVPAAGPHGLGLVNGRLFCASDEGALVVLDRGDGAVLESLPLPGLPDVVMHDAELRRLYVAIGDPGVVCAFDTERLEPLEVVETERGAHTTGWDPRGKCLYVFCPESEGAALYEDSA